MSGFFRLGHTRGRSSSSTSHSYHPQPDFASSFDAPSDDEDGDDNRAGGYDTTNSSSTPARLAAGSLLDDSRAASADRAPLTNPSASTSAARDVGGASQDSSMTLPGGYDFEPQAYEGGGGAGGTGAGAAPPPAIRSSTRPTSFGASRLGSSIYGSHRADAIAYSPGVGGSGHDGDADGQPRTGLLSWRGIVSRLGGTTAGERPEGHAGESNRLLFDESDETDSEHPRRDDSAYPPRNIHLPLPARPPTFAPPPVEPFTSTSTTSPSVPTTSGKVYGGGQSNDGVFANLAAKPDGATNADYVGEGPDKDEVLPAYEAAALDSTPPYWETTVITPGGILGPDDICVDGMPVGNLFSFAWNLLVSMSFQFVGFLLTYLLHTTHAAKNGSRAGLGITLIQLGFYLKQHTDHGGDWNDGAAGDETGLNGSPGPSSSDNVGWSWWGGPAEDIADPASPTSTLSASLGNLPTQLSNGLSDALDASNPDAFPSGMPKLMGDAMSENELNAMSMATNEWMSFALVTVGSFLLIGGCLSYWRAVRYARAMRAGQGPGVDSENMIAVS